MNFNRQPDNKWSSWRRIKNDKRKIMKNKEFTNKYKDIEPSEEEMSYILPAINSHARYVHKQTSSWIDKTEFISDCYIGLLKILENFDEKKCSDKRKYIIHKLKYHLIDAHRVDNGRLTNKYHIKFMSLDVQMDKTMDGDDIVVTIPSEDKPITDQIFEKEVLKIVKKEFLNIEEPRKNSYSGELMFKVLMMHCDGDSYETIAKEIGYTQGTISNMFNNRIYPILFEIKEKLI